MGKPLKPSLDCPLTPALNINPFIKALKSAVTSVVTVDKFSSRILST